MSSTPWKGNGVAVPCPLPDITGCTNGAASLSHLVFDPTSSVILVLGLLGEVVAFNSYNSHAKWFQEVWL